MLSGSFKRLSGQGEDSADDLADLPCALCFSVDALKDSIQQIPRMGLLSVHMCVEFSD